MLLSTLLALRLNAPEPFLGLKRLIKQPIYWPKKMNGKGRSTGVLVERNAQGPKSRPRVIIMVCFVCSGSIKPLFFILSAPPFRSGPVFRLYALVLRTSDGLRHFRSRAFIVPPGACRP